jgi:radical SAM protein with 4Fe4S-binding SPASM domain
MENVLRLLFWETTVGCNLKCIHCRAEATPVRSDLDMSTEESLAFIDDLADFASPILVLSGGEPLYRSDIYQLSEHATKRGLRVALATNGTMVTREVAAKCVEAGVKRAAISLDGATGDVHDSFRAIPGSFDAALDGVKNFIEAGIPVQINTTITKNNVHQTEEILKLSEDIGAVALHFFMLVPVGCGVLIGDSMMISAQQYEDVLLWLYRQSKKTSLRVKATCAPHYFRIMKQEYVRERKAELEAARANIAVEDDDMGLSFDDVQDAVVSQDAVGGNGGHHAGRPNGRPGGHPGAHPGGHPAGMDAITKGCLAGSAVCFVSHRGLVYPCGYLPLVAGDVRKQKMKDIWEGALLFKVLRDEDNLEGKCGACEYRRICMGCRARAFSATGNYLGEEPYCTYEPKGMRA